MEGRQERGLAHPGGGSSRRLRIPKPSAGTLWLWTVAAPSSLPAARRKLKVPLGCAPGYFAGYQGLLTILPKPPPGRGYPISRLLFVRVTNTKQMLGKSSTGEFIPNLGVIAGYVD